jgi:hypothetical protein
MDKNEIIKSEIAMLTDMVTQLSVTMNEVQGKLHKLIVIRDALAETITDDGQLELPFEVVQD